MEKLWNIFLEKYTKSVYFKKHNSNDTADAY